MRNRLFAAIAKAYPTERMSGNKVLSSLWRVLFYGLSPSQPFMMKTEHYKIMAHPKKGTLTRAVIRRGYWEKEETNAFIKHLKPDALVIDAGANFGHYALVAAKYVGPAGRVIAFEPNHDTFALLQSNVALLEHNNVTAVQAGLSDQTGEMALVIDSSNPGGHSFTEGNVRQVGESITVPIDTFDHYLASNKVDKPVSLVKIDVQGFEGKAIKGGAKMILRDRPVVFCEVTPGAMKVSGDDYQELMSFFKEASYSVQFVNSATGNAEEISYEKADEILNQPGREYADLVFIPHFV